MILESNRSLEKCRCEISDAIRSTQLYGRVGGREGKCRFCVTNRRHHGWFDAREPGRLLPIAVYCRGSIVPSGEGVTIRVKFVYGFHMMELMIRVFDDYRWNRICISYFIPFFGMFIIG